MTNAYYNHSSGAPAAQTRGISSSIRAEFDLIAAGFDALSAGVFPVNQPTVTVASAASVAIGAQTSDSIIVSGSTTITSFDTIASGARRFLVFSGALVLTHNATSLILPGAANIQTVAGDAAEFVSLGSGNWRCVNFQPSTVTGSGAAVRANSPTLTNPVINGFSGTGNGSVNGNLSIGGNLTVNAGTIGYSTGAGATATQPTSKSSPVTINKPCGQITMDPAALAAGSQVQFQVNCSVFTTNDLVFAQPLGWTNYRVESFPNGPGSFHIRVTNISAGSLSDAVVINYATYTAAKS